MTFLYMTEFREKNGNPHLSFIVRQCKWPSLSRKVVEIQKCASMVTECLALELQRTITSNNNNNNKSESQDLIAFT